MSIGKWQIKKEVAEMEMNIAVTKEKKAREILALLPSGITLRKIKFMFVDKVVNANKGNLAASARELCVPYRTLVNWIHETDHTTAEARGREQCGKDGALFRKRKAAVEAAEKEKKELKDLFED